MPRKSNARAAQGSGTIRKKIVVRDGKRYVYWEGRVTVGHDPGSGRQIQKSFTASTQKAVRERLQAATVELNNSTYFEAEKMPLSNWLDIWTAEYMSDKKYMTQKTYRANVENHIKPALGAIKLAQLTPPQIQKFYNELFAGGCKVPKRDKTGKPVKKDGVTVFEAAPMSAKTLRNIHGTLTKALAVAVRIGYIRTNPADLATLPRIEKKELLILTDKQIKEFLQAASEDRYGAILKVILFTGLRESEAIGLTWDCINFKDGSIRVYQQLQKRPLKDGGTVFTTLKNGKSRTIKPAPFVMELLKQQRTFQTKLRLQLGDAWLGWSNMDAFKTALIFTTDEGRPITPTTLRCHFKKLVSQIGAPDCRVHSLRHQFAVLSLQNGDDIKTVQGNLGHATAAFTLDVYGHVSERMKDDSAARMQNYIEQIE